jgi:hypothetical protein
MVPISPVWPPASVPDAITTSTPASSCLTACSGAPTRPAHATPRSRARSISRAGAGPSAFAISRIGCANATSSSASIAPSENWPAARVLRIASSRSHVPASPCSARTRSRNAQCSVEIRPASAAESRVELLALPLERLRDDHVDAVRPAAHLLVDPAQLDLELVGVEAHRAEHAEPAGVRDRGDDVAAVAEREQRELDPEQLGDARPHPLLTTRRRRRRAPRPSSRRRGAG